MLFACVFLTVGRKLMFPLNGNLEISSRVASGAGMVHSWYVPALSATMQSSSCRGAMARRCCCSPPNPSRSAGCSAVPGFSLAGRSYVKLCKCLHLSAATQPRCGMEVSGCLPAHPLGSQLPKFPAEMQLGRWWLLGQTQHWEIVE